MFTELERQIFTALQSIFDQFGWLGVAGLAAFESATGIMPVEIILSLAGWLLLANHSAPISSLFLVGLFAAGGSALGASATYWLARLGGRPVVDRVCRWMRISPAMVAIAEQQFQRWGPGLVLFGRIVPGIRILVSIPAGLARMPYSKFLIFTFAGAYIWCTSFIVLGYWFGHKWPILFDFVQTYALVILSVLVAAFLIAAVAFLLRWYARRKTSTSLKV